MTLRTLALAMLVALPATAAAQSPDDAVAGMKSDLRQLVIAQEGFFSDNNDYAGGIVAGHDVSGREGRGFVHFTPYGGNIVQLSYVSSSSWRAVASNASTPVMCGVFVGPTSSSPNPVVRLEGSPGCWDQNGAEVVAKEVPPPTAPADLPVQVAFRKSLFAGKGLVAQFRGPIGTNMKIAARFSRPATQESKLFQLFLRASEIEEFGHLQGWAFQPGDKIELTVEGYAPLDVTVP